MIKRYYNDVQYIFIASLNLAFFDIYFAIFMNFTEST